MGEYGSPSEEDFARAKAARRSCDRGLSDVRERLLNRFHGQGVQEFFLLYSPARNSFGAYVFYAADCDLGKAESSGLSARIRDFVFEELTVGGRGNRSDLDVAFEFDSQENVDRNYAGDYFNRLR
ncbi:hypothetical protein DSM3645_20527 [Blastopirellula marina DSM 3645]|uniref:Uncharacterized protein n=1 Tax=Blastopirellula marina DSM 3645 TaxID=314230 RepID=A3ZQQ7_9BACT|nr:hypothetical protein DSM3645_20527 [Blastopirellula marina DSM 3645]